MLYVLANGPSAADLGVLVCTNGKLQVSLHALDVAEDGKCLLMDCEPMLDLELRRLSVERADMDEAFPVMLMASVHDEKERLFAGKEELNGAIMTIYYDADRRIGLLEGFKSGDGERVSFSWPEGFPDPDDDAALEQRHRFVQTLNAQVEALQQKQAEAADAALGERLKTGAKFGDIDN